MKSRNHVTTILSSSCFAALLLSGCTQQIQVEDQALVGAWRSEVQFTNGPFANIKDLEFLYVFNAGGTMTESSNYDGAPPVPPAYGTWRKVSEGVYEARYEYFWTKPPKAFDDLSKGNGWLPGGHGLLTERITVSQDGQSFSSTIKYEVFDQAGNPIDKASHATARAKRISF